MTQRFVTFALTLLLGLLCACGGAAAQPTATPAQTAAISEPPAETETETPVETETPAVTETETPAETETEAPGPAELSVAEKKRIAEGLIDQSVEACYAAIGYPETSDYAPSCLSEQGGEDGNLYYEGFIVYTFRDNSGNETVIFVE